MSSRVTVSVEALFTALYGAYMNGLAAEHEDLAGVSDEGGVVQLMERFNEVMTTKPVRGVIDISPLETTFKVHGRTEH